MEYKTIPIDLIDAHPENPRQHPDEQLTGLEASYQELGQFRSFVVWQRPGGRYIQVTSHGITEAMKREGATEVRVEVLPEDTDPLRVKQIMLADNLHTQKSHDDETLLVQLLQEQQDAGFDLASLGSSDESLREMLEALGNEWVGESERDEEEDDLPETVETRTKVGDVWQLGRHKIGVFDCRDQKAMEQLLAGEMVHAVVSDPPYGMRLDASYSFSIANTERGIKPSKGYAKVIGDESDFDASLFFKMFPNTKEVFLFGADYYVDTLPNYGKGGSWMVWDKKNEALRNVLGLADFELIWSMQRHKRRVYAILWNGALGTESEDTKRRVHPTQKPVRLLEAIIEEYIKPDMLIVDPYLGSGSTLIACQNLGYRCVGTEIDPSYVDILLSRWESHTGQSAQRISHIEEGTHV